ncbi:STAS domain-containing protein [Nocardioides bizhenqiangii]|uniref:STAS domain-containing protein n=1 Tax=Nocardioides bizhenqiangii TaxID=3095076 RepID=A0ABZ0ZN09_9ACTN|nr:MULTISPECIES: STAS domain-containing protein [unclassified Nocardioides]MDZ5620967.1 STAS domain-containing protein [Nocardioides sp. HM23]WQQ25326.1 STAS domain-containing protein [Nocardioides sp. HM61]
MTVRDRHEDFVAGHPMFPGESNDSSPLLTVRIRFTPNLPVVRLSGELDIASLHLLTDALDSVAAASCPGDLVVLNLAGITFCDVAGLRMIEMCAATLAAADKELILYDAPPQLRKLIKITGVAQHIVHR